MKYLILPVFFLLLCGALYADTLYLRDGQEIRGVIVEDYHDRVVLSTEKNSVCYLKDNIERINYDTPEINLVKLGEVYKDKGDYKTALYYYDAAYKLNPNMKEAQDGTLLVNKMIYQENDMNLEKEVRLRQDTEEKMGLVTAQATALPSVDKAAQLQGRAGLSIKVVSSEIVVDRVMKNSPAGEAGIKEGDIIISIWGKLIRYMQLTDIYAAFLDSGVNELKIVIARPVTLALKKNHIFSGAEDMIGGKIRIIFEGLNVDSIVEGGPLDQAGVLKGDMVTAIEDISTRYMPLESFYKLIEETKTELLTFEIQRELIVWKRG